MEARFFQCWAYVLRGIAMFRECLKRMTRASILHAACLKIINVWSGMLSAWSASRLFRSFSMQYVRALAAREDEQNNTLAHVMCKGFIQRCRRTLFFVSPITYYKHSKRRTVLFRLAKCMMVWARVVLWVFLRLLLFLPGPRETSATLVVQSSGWCFPAFGE